MAFQSYRYKTGRIDTRGHNAGKPATECGQHWTNLQSGCPKCNPNGEHYHYSRGRRPPWSRYWSARSSPWPTATAKPRGPATSNR